MSEARPPWISTAAVLIRDGLLLMALRPRDWGQPGLWELPGGKVDPGETPELALARELEEELGIMATVADVLCSYHHTCAKGTFELIAYVIPSWRGEPTPIEHDELRWVTLEECSALNIAPSDLPAIQVLRDDPGSFGLAV